MVKLSTLCYTAIVVNERGVPRIPEGRRYYQ